VLITSNYIPNIRHNPCPSHTTGKRPGYMRQFSSRGQQVIQRLLCEAYGVSDEELEELMAATHQRKVTGC